MGFFDFLFGGKKKGGVKHDASLPKINTDRSRRLSSIPGQPPDLSQLPPGCPFAERCPQRMPDICSIREPAPTQPTPGQTTRCFLYGG